MATGVTLANLLANRRLENDPLKWPTLENLSRPDVESAATETMDGLARA